VPFTLRRFDQHKLRNEIEHPLLPVHLAKAALRFSDPEFANHRRRFARAQECVAKVSFVPGPSMLWGEWGTDHGFRTTVQRKTWSVRVCPRFTLGQRAANGDLGETVRLGAYPAMLARGGKVAEISGATEISGRHAAPTGRAFTRHSCTGEPNPAARSE
jgi:hypothetical protein